MKRFFTFDADTTEFSWANAYACARAAQLAYAEKAVIGRHIEREWGRQEQTQHHDWRFIENKTTDTQAFVMTTDAIILVSFRGSAAPPDFMTDAAVDLIPGPFGGGVHEGFSDALASVWDSLTAAIADFRGDGHKSLWFTGHSLGAGLAAVAVARLLDMGHVVDGLYTFGQPRTGDARFARDFNRAFKSTTFRFVNNNDVVTRVPPRVLGYRHTGTLRYFDEDGNFHAEMGYWRRLLDRIYGRFADIFHWGTDGIKDHSIGDYVKLIRTHYLLDLKRIHDARVAKRMQIQEELSQMPGV